MSSDNSASASGRVRAPPNLPSSVNAGAAPAPTVSQEAIPPFPALPPHGQARGPANPRTVRVGSYAADDAGQALAARSPGGAAGSFSSGGSGGGPPEALVTGERSPVMKPRSSVVGSDIGGNMSLTSPRERVHVGHPGVTFSGKSHKKVFTRSANKTSMMDKIFTVADKLGLTTAGELRNNTLPTHTEFKTLQRDSILHALKLKVPGAAEASRQKIKRGGALSPRKTSDTGMDGEAAAESGGFKEKWSNGVTLAVDKASLFIESALRDRMDSVRVQKWERAELFYLELMSQCDLNRSGMVSREEFQRILDSIQQYLVVCSGLLSQSMLSTRSQTSLFALLEDQDDEVPSDGVRLKKSHAGSWDTEGTLLQTEKFQVLLRFLAIFKKYFSRFKHLDANSFMILTDVKKTGEPVAEASIGETSDYGNLDDLYAGLKLCNEVLSEKLSIRKKYIWPLLAVYAVFAFFYILMDVTILEACAPVAALKTTALCPFPYGAMFVAAMLFVTHVLIGLAASIGVCLRAPFIRGLAASFVPWQRTTHAVVYVFSHIAHSMCFIILYFVDTSDYMSPTSSTYWGTKNAMNMMLAITCSNYVIAHASRLYKLNRSGARFLLREESSLARFPADVPWFSSRWDRKYLRMRGASLMLMNRLEHIAGASFVEHNGFSVMSDEDFINHLKLDDLDAFEIDRVELNECLTAYDIYLLVEEAVMEKKIRTSVSTKSLLIALVMGFLVAVVMSMQPWFYGFSNGFGWSMPVISVIVFPVCFYNTAYGTYHLLQNGPRMFKLLSYALLMMTAMITPSKTIRAKTQSIPFLSMTSPANIEVWYRVRSFLRHLFLFEEILMAEMSLSTVIFLSVVYVTFLLLFVFLFFVSISQQLHSLAVYVVMGVLIVIVAVLSLNSAINVLDVQTAQINVIRDNLLDMRFTAASRKYAKFVRRKRVVRQDRTTRRTGFHTAEERQAQDDITAQLPNFDRAAPTTFVLDDLSDGWESDGEKGELLDSNLELAKESADALVENLQETDRPLTFFGVELTPAVYTLIKGYFVVGALSMIGRLGLSYSV